MIKSRFVIAGTVLCTVFCFNAEAKLYKWVDESGTTHYGETIPPEYAGRDTKKLDKGRVVDRDDTFDSAKQNSAKKVTVDDKAAVEASRRDNALLNSYSNEKEIDLARNRNLLQVEARINSYSTLLKSAQTTLDDLHKEGDSITKSGRKIPPSLTDDIAESESRFAKLKKEMDTAQKESEAVKARYEADKLRYRELKGQSPSAK